MSLEPHQSNISAALGRDCVASRRYGRLTRMQMEGEGGGGLSVWHRTHGASWTVVLREDRGSGSTCVYPDVWTARTHMEGDGGPRPRPGPGPGPGPGPPG